MLNFPVCTYHGRLCGIMLDTLTHPKCVTQEVHSAAVFSYSQGCGLPSTPCINFIASPVTQPGLGVAWGQIEGHMVAIPALVQCKM